MEAIKITTVIPVYNATQKLGACLTALEKLEIPSTIEHQVVVINDGSTDSTTEYIQNNFPYVLLINLKHNSGRSKAINASKNIDTDYLHFIDIDCLTTDRKLLRNISPYLHGHMVKQLIIGFTSHPSNNFFSVLRRKLKKEKLTKGLASQSTENIIISKSAFSRLSGFDEQYKQYGFEDKDFLIRAEVLLKNDEILLLDHFTVTHPPVETMQSFKDKLYISGSMTSLIFSKDHPVEFSRTAYAKLEQSKIVLVLSKIILIVIPIDKILSICEFWITSRLTPFFLKKLVYQFGFSLGYLRGVHARS